MNFYWENVCKFKSSGGLLLSRWAMREVKYTEKKMQIYFKRCIWWYTLFTAKCQTDRNWSFFVCIPYFFSEYNTFRTFGHVLSIYSNMCRLRVEEQELFMEQEFEYSVRWMFQSFNSSFLRLVKTHLVYVNNLFFDIKLISTQTIPWAEVMIYNVMIFRRWTPKKWNVIFILVENR